MMAGLERATERCPKSSAKIDFNVANFDRLFAQGRYRDGSGMGRKCPGTGWLAGWLAGVAAFVS